jgi:hypothetical protein
MQRLHHIPNLYWSDKRKTMQPRRKKRQRGAQEETTRTEIEETTNLARRQDAQAEATVAALVGDVPTLDREPEKMANEAVAENSSGNNEGDVVVDAESQTIWLRSMRTTLKPNLLKTMN